MSGTPPIPATGAEPTPWEAFQGTEIRIGTVLAAAPNAKARVPAYILDIDLGAFGVKRSSAQVTEHYTAADLVGRQVLCVTSLPPKRVAGIKSEVLVTGFPDEHGRIVLASTDIAVPNGARLI